MAEVWPFRPLRESQEVLSFFTDVMRTGSEEMRVSLRSARQQLAYQYSVRDRLSTAMSEAVTGGIADDWLVPLWFDAVLVNDVLLSDTEIPLVPVGEWQAGTSVILWAGVDDYRVLEIDNYVDGLLTFTTPVGETYDRAFLIPLRTGYLIEGLTNNRNSDAYARKSDWGGSNITQVNFGIREEVSDGVAPTLDYDYIPLIRNCGIITPLTNTVFGDVSYIDNQSGPVVLEQLRDLLTVRYQTAWRTRGADARLEMRQLIQWMRGRDESFYIANLGRNMLLAIAPLIGATSITIKPLLPDAADYIGRLITITNPVGEVEVREVTAAFVVTGPNHRLDFAEPLPSAYTLKAKVAFLRRVRLDTDTIEITHVQGFYSEVVLPLIGVEE